MARFQPYASEDKSTCGLMFWCPGCDRPHAIRTRTSDNGPIWEVTGDGDARTASPSLRVWIDGSDLSRQCHSFVRNGHVEYLGDCWHDLRGKTIAIPEWPYASDEVA